MFNPIIRKPIRPQPQAPKPLPRLLGSKGPQNKIRRKIERMDSLIKRGLLKNLPTAGEERYKHELERELFRKMYKPDKSGPQKNK